MVKIFKRNICNFSLVLAFAAGALAFQSCSEPQFKINGKVDGGEDKTLILAKSDFNGRWVIVDSTRISSSGDFSISTSAPASPEIYRLSLGDRFIYFPIDSIETLTVTSPANAFGSDFTIAGSDQAEKMAEFEKMLQGVNPADSAALSAFKKEVYGKYLRDARGSIFSYYVLTKIIGDKPLYNPESPEDARFYAAVATSFEQFRPTDPHTALLKNVSLDAMRRKNSASGKKRVLEANEIELIDINLQDEKGNERMLSDVTGKGKKTVVIFGMMNERDSPAFNAELAKIYNRFGGAVEFYHISLDADRYAWRDAAANLPWITVYEPEGASSKVLLNYNVTRLPAFYIYNERGSLTDRADNLEQLNKKL